MESSMNMYLKPKSAKSKQQIQHLQPINELLEHVLIGLNLCLLVETCELNWNNGVDFMKLQFIRLKNCMYHIIVVWHCPKRKIYVTYIYTSSASSTKAII